MVRSNELGCRNGWNADLWVPAVTDDVEQRAQPADPIGERAAAEVGSAQEADFITSIVAAKTTNVSLPPDQRPSASPVSSRIEEDVFLTQTPSLTWSTGPISAQPATELVQNPKAAILRARDQFRQRRKAEGRLADRQPSMFTTPLLASAREANQLFDQDLLEPDPVLEAVDPRYENRPLLRPQRPPTFGENRPVPPVSLDEIDRPFPSMTDFPEDRDRFESIPEPTAPLDDFVLTENLTEDTWLETRQLDTVAPEPYLIDEPFEDERPALIEAETAFDEEEFSVRHRESVINRFLRQRRERRDVDHATEPETLARELTASAPTYPESPSVYSDRYQASAAATPPADAWEREIASSSLPNDDFILPPPPPETGAPPVPYARPPRHVSRAPQPTRPDTPADPRASAGFALADEFGDQPLFASSATAETQQDYEIDPASGTDDSRWTPSYRTERLCQTCRDFRPADNGERGWCNNKWAFNHRRMVDADDLACRNSLGSWWTPKDDVWRRDGDISRHAQQTPRVDQWLFGTDSDDQRGRRSGS